MENKKIVNTSVLAFGELTYDSFIPTPASFFKDKGLEPGKVLPYTDELHNEVFSKFKLVFAGWGGGTANAVKGMKLLGHKVGVLAAAADDQQGLETREGIQKAGIENLSVMQAGRKSSQCFCCIHEDATRTLYRLFDPELALTPDQVDWEKISQYGYLLIAGFEFVEPKYDAFIDALIENSKKCSQKFALVLAEMFWVPTFKGRILDFLQHTSIITGNESEFRQLFGKETREELLDHIQSFNFELAVMTMGPEGAWLMANGERVWVDAGDQTRVIDSLAAGDFFTAGALYGFLNGYSLETSGKIASMMALDVISRYGNYASLEVKEQIEEFLKTAK